MQFDKQEHKDIVAALIEQANFPGKILELAIELKRAVATSQITPEQAAQ